VAHWTIGKRLIFGFVAVITVSIILGVFAYLRLVSINNAVDDIAGDTLPGLAKVEQLATLSRDIRSFLQEHVATERPEEKAQFDKEISTVAAKYDGILKEYEKTVATDEERKLLDGIKTTLVEYRRVRDEVLALSRDGKNAAAYAQYQVELEPRMAKYFDALDAAVAYNVKDADDAGHSAMADVSAAKTGILIGLLAAMIVSVVVAWLLVVSINKSLTGSLDQLSSGAEQVASASGQVATSAQSLSQGATEQAASLEETSASMEEMASMTRKNAESTQEAASLMGDVDSRVQESNRSLADMVTSMNAIQESSQKVAKIIKTIDEIAFQTNILALNAAVEAARAGEAGMGFAVVADEVRNLAQRSAQAAKDTAGLIEESMEKAVTGVDKVQQVSTSIAAITDSVTKVKGLVDEVSIASRQQAQGIDQVSQAIAQMEKVTQTTAATAEESAAASEELSAQSETVRAVVVELGALVGRRGGTAAGPSAKTAPKPAGNAGAAASNIVALPAPAPRESKAGKTAEEILPLGDTGTFGKF
jgi:methyl-accepting chemotaxis protein